MSEIEYINNKDVFEPSYNDLKFTVWNHDYVCINLILQPLMPKKKHILYVHNSLVTLKKIKNNSLISSNIQFLFDILQFLKISSVFPFL